MSETFTLPEQIESALDFIEDWIAQQGEDIPTDLKDLAIRGLQARNSWQAVSLRFARSDEEEAKKWSEQWKNDYYKLRSEQGKGEEHLDEAIAMLRKFCGQREEWE